MHLVGELVTNKRLSNDLRLVDVSQRRYLYIARDEDYGTRVRADDLLEGDTRDPERHPIALALRRQDDVDDACVTNNETLVRSGEKWFRYDAPDKRLFKKLQKTLTAQP